MSYFVVGLPRSRTAWLSVFLSQSGMHCFHDGFNGCKTLKEYHEKIYCCGDSSTGLMLFDLNKEYPDSPVLIIEKTEEEIEKCILWCDLVYGGSSREVILDLNERMKKIEGLRIMQSDVYNKLPEIWSHLIGAIWSDHYALMTNLNIQANPYNIDFNVSGELLNEIAQ